MTDKTELAALPEDAVGEDLANYLRAEAIVDAINAQLPAGKNLPAIPKGYVFRKSNREVVSTALHAAFELVGGLPAFVQWGVKNPKEFYGLWSKLLPTDTTTPVGGTTIVFNSAVPQNPLDYVSVDEAGKVISLDPNELPE